jgi:hypothetical protein
MMANNDLLSNWWDKLYCTAVYLYLRTPCSSVPKTPYEIFWEKKLDLSHFREIGAQAFVLKHVGKSKSKDQSFECVLVGYSQSAKAYCLYYWVSHRVLHVDFIEHKDDIAVSHHPGQIVNTVDSIAPTISTFYNLISLPDSSFIVDSSPVSVSISPLVSENVSTPSQVLTSISVPFPYL